MGLDTNFNQDPYYDDFDENKNFHRVLFKPAVAVQARELTQLQTILQNQIERFGNNILKEGTIISGCRFVFLDRLVYVKILDLQTDGQPVVMSNYADARAVGLTTGVEAKIISVSTGLQSQTPNLNTLHVRYVKSGTSGAKTFSSTENIRIENFNTAAVITTVTAAGTVEASSIGNGTGLKVNDGIIYQKGNFIKIEEQTVIVSKYSTAPDDLAVGFVTTETIVNSFNDTSLLDNAQGYNNENAPGADRLKLTSTLTVKSVSAAQADEKFFTLIEYQNGEPVKRRTRTAYNILAADMAERRSEESGDYNIKAFQLHIEAGANSDYVIAKVGGGLSYVDGYRIQNFGTIDVNIDASTTYSSEIQQNVTTNMGHYIVVDEFIGNFQYNDISTVYLYDTAQNARTANNSANTSNLTVGATQIGTAKIRGFEYHSGTVGTNTCQYRGYLFDIRMANTSVTFEDTKTIIYDEGGGAEGTADIVLNSANKAAIQDFSFKKTFFPIGRSAIRAIPGATADFYYSTSQTMALTSGAGNISAPSGSIFPYSDGTLSSTQKTSDIILVNAIGLPINLDGATVTISGSGSTMTFASVGTTNGTVTVYHKTKRTPAVALTKEPRTVYVQVDTDTAPGGVTGQYSLGLPDVYDIVEVRKHTAAFSTGLEGTDVTDQFTLYPNQRDAYYGLSFVKKLRSLTINASDHLLFKVKVFDRTGSSGKGYASVESYITLPTSPINYEDIPVYVAEDGREFDLRNVLDFRPYATATAAYSTTVGGATTVTTSVDVAPTFSGEQYNVSPNENAEIDYSYYQGRIDKIFVDGQGNFKSLTGVPGDRPLVPSDPAKGMVIGTIAVPPYPALTSFAANRANKPEHSVKIKLQNTRGYTMRDIGKIDRRLKQLEYYTILNALEKKTDDMVITDGAGNDRFKNGIFVDPFDDLSLADVKNVEFDSAIDPARKELTPKLSQFDMDLNPISTSNVTDFGRAATLSKTDVVLIDQPYATISRNCVSDFYSFKGEMLIFPEYDTGYDLTRSPDFNIEVDLATPFMEFTEALNQFVPLQRSATQVITDRVTNVNVRFETTGFREPDTITTRTIERTLEATTDALQVTAGDAQTTQQVGDFVTDVRFNPFMKEREISVLIFGVRPNTTMHFYFDKVDVDAHVAPAVCSNLDDEFDVTNFVRSRVYGTAVSSDANGIVKAIFRIPAETFFVGDRVLEAIDVDIYDEKENAISKASITYSAFNYSVDKSRFAVTTRQPQINVTTNVVRSTSQRQETTVQFGAPIFSGDGGDGDAGDGGGGGGGGGGCDPLAQTFFIIDNMAPGDNVVYVTKLDLYFKEKSTDNSGVTVMLRETVNGRPAPTVVPFGKVHITNAQVNANSTAAAATTVTFDAPIGLKTNAEYCFVVKPDGDNPDYRLWVAKTGGTDVTRNIKITQDVSDGTLFSSSNDRAYTAIQDENAKYTLYRANFSSASGTISYSNKESEYFSVNSVSGTFNNDEYVFVNATPVSAQTVNMQVGNTTIVGTNTTFSSYLSPGDHLVVQANTTHFDVLEVRTVSNNTQIIVKDIPKYTNTASDFFKSIVGTVTTFDTTAPAKLYLDNSTATTSTYFQAGNVLVGEDSRARATIQSVDNKNISLIAPNIYRVNTTQTATNLKATRLHNDVANTSYNLDGVAFNDYNFLTDNSTVVKSYSNEKADSDANRSFVLEATLQNVSGQTVRYSSPVLDNDLASVKCMEYVINNSSTDEDTTAGAAETKYLTKAISLRDGLDAEDLKVFLTAYNPPDSTIEVYGKFQASSDPYNFVDNPWTKLTPKANNPVSSGVERDDFRELEFGLPSAAPVAGAAYLNASEVFEYTDGTAIYNNYKYFAIKIVLLSSGHHRVPRVADLSAIALAS